MRREQLEHLIRAAAAISGEREIVIIGAAAILGAVPEAPAELTQTMEADLFPLHAPALADVIDGAIGELSPFHEHFTVYAHGVGPETAILPPGWRDRLVRVEGPATGGAVGLCLEPHDLAAAKLAAGREKDHTFVKEMLARRFVDAAVLLARVDSLPIPDPRRATVRAWLDRVGAGS